MYRFKGHGPFKLNPGNAGEGYSTQTARLESNTLVKGDFVFVRDEEGAIVGARGGQAPLVLGEKGTGNTTSTCIGGHAYAMNKYGACTGYMRRHGLRSEGGLRGEHAVCITKEGTFTAFLRYESTKKEVMSIFLTKAKKNCHDIHQVQKICMES